MYFATEDGVATFKHRSKAKKKGADVPFAYLTLSQCRFGGVLRARYPNYDKAQSLQSRLRIPISLRQTLNIPDDYPGNVLLNSAVETALRSLIAETTQREVAFNIRSSLTSSRETGQALDAMKLSFVLPDLAYRHPISSDRTGKDLVLTSWRNLSYYRHGWGEMFGNLGHAEFVRIPRGHLGGICALLPNRIAEQVEVLVSLEKDQMDRLRHDAVFSECFQLKAL